MIEFKLETAANNGSEGLPAVSIIGVGGAGANVLDHIALEGMDGVELISMNCDVRSLTTSMAQRKVQLGKSLTQGLGCGGDPELGQEAAAASVEDIRDAIGGRRMIFLCVGLGGGTGSGAAPVITRLARETGAFVIVFATMPFVFEGKRRMQQALAALEEIRRHANALVCFENDKMGELVLPKKGVTEAFEVADRIICQSVRAVTTVATQPGLIRIGMDDLITALRNADSRCLFGFGQAKGEARAADALQLALKSPLLDRGQLLEKARNVLVHICGGTSLTLFEIETLMRELTKHVCPEAQILFGAACDARLADTLSVTIISSLGKGKAIAPAATEQSAAPAPKPAPAVTPKISPQTPAVPILSVQPRHAPPSNVAAARPATTTGVSSAAPALKMSTGMTPPVVPATPPLLASLTPPAELVRAAAEAAARRLMPLESELEDASEVEHSSPADETKAAEAPREPAAETRGMQEPVVKQEAEDAVIFEDEESVFVEARESAPLAQDLMEEEISDRQAVEEPEFIEEVVAERAFEQETGELSPFDEDVVAEVGMEVTDETEAGPQHPAFAADRDQLTSAPMKPIEVRPPSPKGPAPARKFDLREILQRQRQTRLGQYSRSAPPPADTPPPAKVRPPAPARSAPATDRTPDPARVTPIRPILAAQPPPREATHKSPFIPTKPPEPAGPAGNPRGSHTQQATFDERLTPAGRGRFEKAEPTVEEGEDLDIPTFLRKKR